MSGAAVKLEQEEVITMESISQDMPKESTTEKTKQYFSEWDNYSQLVDSIDTYRHISQALDGELNGKLLDVGNGGVFNFDISAANEIVALDIAEEIFNGVELPPHVRFQLGDARELPLEENSFDTVSLQMIIHHLADKNYPLTKEQSLKALREAYRVLRPGGRIVVVESCLPKAWEIAERGLYPFFSFFVNQLGHPPVFQWNWDTLGQFLDEVGFREIQPERISLGKWVIQLGVKWPTALTPIRIYKIVAIKPVN